MAPIGASLRTRRLLAISLILVLLSPTAVSGLTHEEGVSQPTTATDDGGSLVAVATQGDDVGNGEDSRVLVVDPRSRETVWQTTRYPTYFDVDPLNESTLLYAAELPNGEAVGVVRNWQTGTVYDRFELANGTHDVDALGDGRYVYADGANHRVVVVNVTDGRDVVWTYDFTERFPPSAGGGPADSYAGDYTHLNDVDAVGDGAFLVSPRNFDRVLLIDRGDRSVRWTLGSEDDYDTLYEQHNPTLLTRSPPTVLVADSENDRIVEYRRTDGKWRQVWAYARDLEWPRDADRLPGGDTLLLDSRSVLRVTPDREVVWKLRVPKFPYDIERIDLGDEPRGPSMTAFRDEFEGAAAPGADDGPLTPVTESVTKAHATAGWVIPFWVTLWDFLAAVGAFAVAVVWAGFELDRANAEMPGPPSTTDWTETALAAGLLLAGGVTLFQSVAPSLRFADGVTFQWWRWDPFFHVVGGIGLLEVAVTAERRLGATGVRSRVVSVGRAAGAVVVTVTGLGLLAVSLGVGTDGIVVSNPGRIQVAGTGAVLLGGRRLLVDAPSAGVFDTTPLSRLVADNPTAVGAGAVSVGVWALVGGATAVARAPGYLAVGLLLALVGRRHLLQTAATDGLWGSVRRGTWFLLRVPVAVGVVGTLARVVGVGSIEGVSLSLSVVSPLLVTAALSVTLVAVRGETR